MNARRFRRPFDDVFNPEDLHFRAWLASIGEHQPSQEDWQAAWAQFSARRQHKSLCRFAWRRWLRGKWRAFKTASN